MGDVPPDIVERYAHKFEVLEPLPAPRPVVTDEVPITEPPGVDVSDLSVAAVLEAVDSAKLTLDAALVAERAGRRRVTLIRELEARAGGQE